MADFVRKIRVIAMMILGGASVAAVGVGAILDGDRLFMFGLGGASVVIAFVALEVAQSRANS